jgi:hypothetical protein
MKRKIPGPAGSHNEAVENLLLEEVFEQDVLSPFETVCTNFQHI